MGKTILNSADFIIKKKIPCPKFTGPGGIEGLLWVEESFRKICKRFKWDTDRDKMFDNFDLLLEDGAADHWETIIKGKPTTVQNFEACIETFRIIYSWRIQETSCINTYPQANVRARRMLRLLTTGAEWRLCSDKRID